MSFANVTLTPADLPQPAGYAQTNSSSSGSGSLYDNYVSHHGAGSYVPASEVAERHSPVLGGDGP